MLLAYEFLEGGVCSLPLQTSGPSLEGMQWAALLSSWEITCLPGIQARPSWWNLFWEQHLLLGVKLRVTGACGLPPSSQPFSGVTFCWPLPLGAKSRRGSCRFILGSNRTPSKCLSACQALNVSSGNYFRWKIPGACPCIWFPKALTPVGALLSFLSAVSL